MAILGFWPVLQSFLTTTAAQGSAVQIMTKALWLPTTILPVRLGKTRKEVGSALPILSFTDGDETLADETDSFQTTIGAMVAIREVLAWIVVPRGNHAEQLNRLQDALIQDLDSAIRATEGQSQIPGTLNVAYIASDSDYDTMDNSATRAVSFAVHYQRR
jgi:hypothetical protein